MSVHLEGVQQLVEKLQGLGADIDDLSDEFADIASRGAKLAASFAPRRSGALAASIRPVSGKHLAVVEAGGPRVRYAEVLNYGSKPRGIKATHYLQRADQALAPHIVGDLERALEGKVRDRGLS